MADPVVPSTDLINYVFGFANAGAAVVDPALQGYIGQEMLIFFPSVSSVVPVQGFQPMVSKYGPIIDALFDHPNLLFAYNQTASNSAQSSILKTIYTPEQMDEIILIINAVGSIANYGIH